VSSRLDRGSRFRQLRRREAIAFGVLLELQRLLPGSVGSGAQQRLGHLESVSRHLADPTTPSLSGGEQLIMGMDLLNETELEGLGGGDVGAAHIEGNGRLLAEAAGE
jgi:hypothetical protein